MSELGGAAAVAGSRQGADPEETLPREAGGAEPAETGVGTFRPEHAAWALGSLLLLYRVWQLSQASFWQDDFVYLYRADRSNLTLPFLLQEYGGHLMPGTFLSTKVVTQFGDNRWLVAAAGILAAQALIVWLAVRVVLALFGSRWATILPLTVLLFSPLWGTPALWWASALQSLPLQAALLASILVAHRMLARPGPRDAVLLGCILAAGLLFWEKALVVPWATIGVLSVDLACRGSRLWPALRQVVARLRLAVAAWLVVSSAYVVLYLAHVDLGRQLSSGSGSGRLAAFRYAFSSFLVGMAGGPWRSSDGVDTMSPSPASGAVFIAAQLVIAGMVVVWLVTGARRLALATALTGFFFLADAASVALTRVGVFGPQLASDPRYFTESVIIAALALGICLTAPRESTFHRALRPHVPRRRVLVSVAVVVFLNSALVTQQYLTDHAARRRGGAWVAQARSEVQRSGPVAVDDGPVPGEIMMGLFFDDARASRLLADHRLPISWNASSADLRIFDGMGVLRQADVKDVEADSGKGPDGECGWNVHAGGTTRVALPSVDLRDRPVVIGYFTGRPAEVTVTMGGRSQDLTIPEGLNRMWVFNAGARIDSVDLDLVQGGTVCVTDVRVGTVWPKS